MKEQIKPLPTKKINQPDDYLKSPSELKCRTIGGERIVMRKTGITAPCYPERAVYAKRISQVSFDTDKNCYVFDGGFLWPAREWHQFFRDNKQTPGQAL
jgi:hypothetical protein